MIIAAIDPVLEKEKPDAFLVWVTPIVASLLDSGQETAYSHIPYGSGNRCFDQRVPEETNRKIVDHIADINLTYSAIAREYLLREGLPADRIIKTGSPMFEVLHHYLGQIRLLT